VESPPPSDTGRPAMPIRHNQPNTPPSTHYIPPEQVARKIEASHLARSTTREFTWSFGGFAEWTVIEGLLARSARKAFGVEDQQAVAFQLDPATVDKIGQRLVRRLP
jgi:hypothetical protein